MEREKFMRMALEEARKAYELGEVPVGAVVVRMGEVIGRGFNRREREQNPILHAEIVAIMEASKNLGSWRLEDCDIYVTLEPCPMCAGAIIMSRIKRVFFGVKDPKMGAIESKLKLFEYQFNHKVEWIGGILKEECSKILKDFFKKLREGKENE